MDWPTKHVLVRSFHGDCHPKQWKKTTEAVHAVSARRGDIAVCEVEMHFFESKGWHHPEGQSASGRRPSSLGEDVQNTEMSVSSFVSASAR